MALFSKKVEINFEDALVKVHSPEERRLNTQVLLAAHYSQLKPELALELLEDVTDHPILWRTRGWCYATLEDLTASIASFERGFALGDVRCGVYAHRLIRDHTSDREKLETIQIQLKPFFEGRDPDLLMAQAKLSLEVDNTRAAISNHLTYMCGEEFCEGAAITIFATFRGLYETISTQLMKNPEEPSDEEAQAVEDALNHFFEEELRTAEGDPIGWPYFIYLVNLGTCLERELENGDFQSAGMLPEFTPIYEWAIDSFDPPIRPKIYSVEEIAKALINSIDRGNIYALHEFAPNFFEENNLDQSILKKYQNEFKSWGFNKYLEI